MLVRSIWQDPNIENGRGVDLECFLEALPYRAGKTSHLGIPSVQPSRTVDELSGASSQGHQTLLLDCWQRHALVHSRDYPTCSIVLFFPNLNLQWMKHQRRKEKDMGLVC